MQVDPKIKLPTPLKIQNKLNEISKKKRPVKIPNFDMKIK